MPAYRVTWTQPATLTANVTIDLRDLAEWALTADVVRKLGIGGADAVTDAAMLTRSLERNEHLRDAVLQQWASQHVSQ